MVQQGRTLLQLRNSLWRRRHARRRWSHWRLGDLRPRRGRPSSKAAPRWCGLRRRRPQRSSFPWRRRVRQRLPLPRCPPPRTCPPTPRPPRRWRSRCLRRAHWQRRWTDPAARSTAAGVGQPRPGLPRRGRSRPWRRRQGVHLRAVAVAWHLLMGLAPLLWARPTRHATCRPVISRVARRRRRQWGTRQSVWASLPWQTRPLG